MPYTERLADQEYRSVLAELINKSQRPFNDNAAFWTTEQFEHIARLVKMISMTYTTPVEIYYHTHTKIKKAKDRHDNCVNILRIKSQPADYSSHEHIASNFRHAEKTGKDTGLPSMVSSIFGTGLLTTQHPRVRKIIALNLGSPESFKSSFHYIILNDIVSTLMTTYNNYNKSDWAADITITYQSSDLTFPESAVAEERDDTTSQLPGMSRDLPHPVKVRYVHDPQGFLEIDDSTLVVCLNAENPYREMLGDFLDCTGTTPAGMVCMDVGDDRAVEGNECYAPRLENWVKQKGYDCWTLFDDVMATTSPAENKVIVWIPLNVYLKKL